MSPGLSASAQAGDVLPARGRSPGLERPPHRAAVDRDRSAVDVTRERGGQERNEMANVVGLAEIAGRNVLPDVVGPRSLGRMQPSDLRRINAPRCDRVDGDPAGAEFGGQRP